MARSHGRHRKPSTTGQTVARVATQSAVVMTAAAVPAVLIAPSASALTPTVAALNVIASCESGNRNINNTTYPVSSASGYFQIIDGTWRRHGGTEFASRAIGATREQQLIVAQRIAASRGSYADWNPSKNCWGSKISSDAPSATRRTAPKTTPKTATPAPSASRAADGTGTFVCTRDKLYFDSCDPENLGDTVQYPRYKSVRTLASTETLVTTEDVYVVRPGDTLAEIAAAQNTSVRKLHDSNRSVIGSNPNRIYPGQRLAV